MSRVLRLGAVNYLNVRPLVYGLEKHADTVAIRFDPPSHCARLLDEGRIDLGMVPSIAYLDRPGDRVVPGVCIGSEGPVESVALYSRRPIRDVRSIALDTSSRTSAALVRILCRRVFNIAPSFVDHPPDITPMLAAADAALLIGDAALFLDHRVHRAEKHDLGALWTDMTSLPFVWAFWSGRPDAATAQDVAMLQDAAELGMSRIDEIAAAYRASVPAEIPLAARYLREHLLFRFTRTALEGVLTYYREAAAAGVVDAVQPIQFFDGPNRAAGPVAGGVPVE